MSYLFSSESVSEGHPDKVSDQISDALLDQFLAYDSKAHCAIESFVTTGQVVIMGEVRSSQYVDLQTIARRTINNIGYTKAEYHFDGDSCGILSAIHEQSDDINRGVSRAEEADQGAGDQGMMFGYACNETENYMPVSLDLAHLIMRTLTDIRKEGQQMTYLRPDAKSQVTIQYSDEGIPECIDTIVVSTQHDDFIKPENDSQEARDKADEAMLSRIYDDVLNILIPRVKAQLGEKDPSKVDRSAAYAARYIAKNMVAAGVADEMLVQLAYAIGVADPVSVYVNTYGRSNVKMTDSEIAKTISQLFDLRPNQIEKTLKLRQPIYLETAAYGHMGRKNEVVEKTFTSFYHETKTIKVELFTWEKLDQVERIRKAFAL